MHPSTAKVAAALHALGVAGQVTELPEPAPTAASIWQNTMGRCAGVMSVRAELAVSGRTGGRSIPGLAGARVGTAVDHDGNLAFIIDLCRGSLRQTDRRSWAGDR